MKLAAASAFAITSNALRCHSLKAFLQSHDAPDAELLVALPPRRFSSANDNSRNTPPMPRYAWDVYRAITVRAIPGDHRSGIGIILRMTHG